MKKTLLLLFSLLLLSTCTFATESQVNQTAQSILQSLKNAVIQDVSNTVENTLNTAVNQVKLAKDKAQLAQKKKELEELENSSTFFIVKIYKRIKLNSDISKLEKEIEELESGKSK